MKFRIVAAVVAFLGLSGAGAPPPASDIAAIFGAREALEHVSLSPDGTKLAYIVPTMGQGSALYTLGIQVGSKPQLALVADGDPGRLDHCNWASNDRLVCMTYGITPGSLELLPFSRLIAVNADGSKLQMLSTRQNLYSRGLQLGGGDIIDWLPDEDGMVLMTRQYVPDDHLGTRLGSEARGLGVDRINTRTLATTKVEAPYADAIYYLSDGHGAVRILGARRSSAGMDTGVISYSYRLKGSREWRKLGDVNTVTNEGFDPYAIDYERDAAYGFRKKDGRWALYRMALDGSAKEELIFARPDVDVDQLVTIGRRGRVIGVSYVTDIRHFVYFDPDLNKLATSLGKALPNQPLVRIAEASQDESKLLIWAGSDNDPGSYYVYDRKTHELATFSAVRPLLEGRPLATVKAVSYPAADGTMVPAYLTLPPGRDPTKLPAIVLPHGGPSARDEWGFDWLSQFYAARGYAVLQPNFRGSSGYGDAWFKDNGFRSWKTAIGDVNDAGHWLVAQHIADPAKLAIVGWSYGGYAALQSAVIEPGLFKAVVAIAPVTDLATLKEERRNWTDFVLASNEIGDGPHIREASPAQNADRIKVPVLMFHAELDRNVRIRESQLMDARLKDAGVPHELVTWSKLDHQLVDSAARAQMLSKSDAFLRASMGM
ncbi:MAG: family peptidase [Rhizorhabdus sp.]|nr:family peptidase [Rhizorhabdus sp.]